MSISDMFWRSIIVCTVVLYGWMSLSSMDEGYNLKVMSSAYSVLGEHENLIHYLENEQEFNEVDSNSNTLLKAEIVTGIEM